MELLSHRQHQLCDKCLQRQAPVPAGDPRCVPALALPRSSEDILIM